MEQVIVKFTKRQVQIIDCLERGLSNIEISNELQINEHTVKVHLWRLYKKLGVSSRLQTLVAYQSMKVKDDSIDAKMALLERMYIMLYDMYQGLLVNRKDLKRILYEYKVIRNSYVVDKLD